MCRIALLIAVLSPLAAHGLDDIAPLIDRQTLVVARVDVHRINTDSWIDLAAPFIPEAPQALEPVRNTARAWLETYRKRGGREVYIVFNMGEISDPPCLLTPIAGDLERADLAEMLKMLIGGNNVAHARIGKLLAVGTKAAIDRMKTRKPAARPEFARALAAVDGVARIAVALPANMRRVFEETVDELPGELGGGSVRVLTRDLAWLAMSVDAPPTVRLRLVTQAADAEAALRLTELAEKLLTLAGSVLSPGSKHPLVKVYATPVRRVTDLLERQVEKSQLGVSADLGPELPEFMKLTRDIRGLANRAKSTNILRQIGLALHHYHDAYGHLPTDIRDGNGK